MSAEKQTEYIAVSPSDVHLGYDPATKTVVCSALVIETNSDIERKALC
jgi:hypothetical protein